MKIKTNDSIETKENLTNHKPWFNGPKKFSSVKVIPPVDESEGLKPIGVHVEDRIDTNEKLS